jgi:hypothetical protein
MSADLETTADSLGLDTGAAVAEPADEPAPQVGKSKRSRPRKTGSSKHANPAPVPGESKSVSELDDLLGGAPVGSAKQTKSAKKSKRKKSAGAAKDTDPSLPKSLTRAQVQSGLKRVAHKVKRCGKKSSGILMMRVVIGKNGRVSQALPTGALAGSKTGKCAARAVRRARFPKFAGSRITVTYPFRL